MLGKSKFYSANILVYSLNLSSIFSILIRFLIIFSFCIGFSITFYLDSLFLLVSFFSLESFVFTVCLIAFSSFYLLFLYGQLKLYTSFSIYKK